MIHRIVIVGFIAAAIAGAASAQSIEGDWHGELVVPPTIRVGLHVEKTPTGGFKVLAYSDTQEPGRASSDWTLTQTGDEVKLSTPSSGGQRIEAKWSPSDSAWKGQYFANFGAFPVTLTKGPIPANPKVDGLDGEWAGVLDAGSATLRIIVGIKTENGATTGWMQSPDQTDQKINLIAARQGETATFTIPGVLGAWAGKVSADGKTLDGTWTQPGGSLPLKMTKK